LIEREKKRETTTTTIAVDTGCTAGDLNNALLRERIWVGNAPHMIADLLQRKRKKERISF
jgi:hypothetical protein